MYEVNPKDVLNVLIDTLNGLKVDKFKPLNFYFMQIIMTNATSDHWTDVCNTLNRSIHKLSNCTFNINMTYNIVDRFIPIEHFPLVEFNQLINLIEQLNVEEQHLYFADCISNFKAKIIHLYVAFIASGDNEYKLCLDELYKKLSRKQVESLLEVYVKEFLNKKISNNLKTSGFNEDYEKAIVDEIFQFIKPRVYDYLNKKILSNEPIENIII